MPFPNQSLFRVHNLGNAIVRNQHFKMSIVGRPLRNHPLLNPADVIQSNHPTAVPFDFVHEHLEHELNQIRMPPR